MPLVLKSISLPLHNIMGFRQVQPCNQCGRLAVTVREPHPQSLAFATSPMSTGHIGRRPGLVDEHEPFWIEVELLIETSIGAFLEHLDGFALSHGPSFFRVCLCRIRKRCNADLLMMMPCAAKSLRSSKRVPSRFVSSQVMIRSA